MLPLPPAFALLVYLLVALTGLAAGAGVNAIADHIAGDEEPPWRGGECAACHTPLPSRRFVPVVGWLLIGRRCPACGAAVSMRRPLVEVTLALAFPLLLAHVLAPAVHTRVQPGVLFALDALVATVLALVFVIDLEHHLILDIITYPTAVTLVALALLLDRKALAGMAVGAVVAGGLFLLLYGLGFLLYRVEALGFGDVKLAALIGMVVGWPGIMGALGLGAFFGFAVAIALLGLGRVTRESYIPFGTFLSLGAVLALLTSAPLW